MYKYDRKDVTKTKSYKKPRLVKYAKIKRIQAASVAEGEFVQGIGGHL